MVAAALATLAAVTGHGPDKQKPADKDARGDAVSAAAHASTDGGTAASSDAASAPATPATGTAGSDSQTDAAAAQATASASPAQKAATATDAKDLAPAAAGKPGDANSDNTADQPSTATAPATAGQYTQQSAASAASTSTNATTEVTASQAQGQASSTQQSVDPKLDQKGNDVAKLPVTAAAASQPVAATSPQAQGATQSAASPAPSQQDHSGRGAHQGNGSGSHSGTPGQPNAGNQVTNTGVSGTSQTTSPFTVGAASAGQTTSAQQTAAAGSHEIVRTAVALQDAVDAVKATFTAANQAGVSTARIVLSPESLGGIKISLSQTPDGLIARVATDHPEAAMTLQQSAGDLKRQLEDSGMALLRLDISSSGQQNQGSFAGSAGDGSQAGSSWAGGTAGGGVEEEATSTPTELTSALSSGSLVNVLA